MTIEQHALSPVAVNNLAPKDKLYRVHDGAGLYIEVPPQGKKRWRARYLVPGKRGERKQDSQSLGTFPTVGLAAARAAHAKILAKLEKGEDPKQKVRDEAKAVLDAAKQAQENKATSFKVVAMHWFDKNKATWAAKTIENRERRFDKDIFPRIGERPIASITRGELREVFLEIEKGSPESARKGLRDCRLIFDDLLDASKDQDASTFNPTPTPKIFTKRKVVNRAAVTKAPEFGQLLNSLGRCEGSAPVRLALKLLPLVFVRPGELRFAKWKDIDIANRCWSFVMPKVDRRHIVPFSRQAIAIIEELRPLTSPLSEFLFPNEKDPTKPMSDNTLNHAMRKLGIDQKTHCAHGFRASARTLLDESLRWPVPIIRYQLGHILKASDPVDAAYNRGRGLNDRPAMMQEWADYLDDLKAGKNNVIPLRKVA